MLCQGDRPIQDFLFPLRGMQRHPMPGLERQCLAAQAAAAADYRNQGGVELIDLAPDLRQGLLACRIMGRAAAGVAMTCVNSGIAGLPYVCVFRFLGMCMPKQTVHDSATVIQEPAALKAARLLAGFTRNGPAAAWFDRLLAVLANRVFAVSLARSELDFLRERRLAVEFEDLAVCWVFSLHAGRLRVLEHRARPEVSIRARLADFAALALRRVDADTLFFQQRLVIEGDVALGLMLKNFLDALELDQLAWPVKFALLAGERLLSDTRRTSA